MSGPDIPVLDAVPPPKRKITAMTMKPISDERMETIRSNLAGKWELSGGGKYTETVRTEDATIQGMARTLTYVDWEEV